VGLSRRDAPCIIAAPTIGALAMPTSRKKTLLVAALLLVHAAVTARTLLDHGYFELVAFPFTSWPAGQVFSDLCVSLLLVTSWLIADARETGRNPWPYVLATVAVGSFGPLVYLLVGMRGASGDGVVRG
jgi:hypothetical protein